MSQTLKQVQALAARGEVRISAHGYEELGADGILVRDIVSGLGTAIMLEDYPDFPKGPCVLVLEQDGVGKPLHVVWGIPRGKTSPAVVVTAYRPDPAKWDDTWRRRRK